jgi:hypothetical protein
LIPPLAPNTSVPVINNRWIAGEQRRIRLAGDGIHVSETVRTGNSGQADLRFIDSTNLNVGPSSSVHLDKFVYDPKKGSGSVAIDAAKGAFRFVTGSQKKGDYNVKTPYGTIGMRG